MKKKLIALAVASVFAAPAVALAAAHTGGGSTVTIFGTINSDYSQASTSGTSAAGTPGSSFAVLNPATAYTGGGAVNVTNRSAINNNSTNIGFKGTEDLGGGLGVTWQCETGVNPDGGSAGGNGVATTMCNRNSKIGLESKAWGEVFLGNWDTPYKLLNISALDPFYGQSTGSQNSMIGSPGFNVVTTGSNVLNAAALADGTAAAAVTGAARAAFDLRLGNSIGYVSPKLMGAFTIRAAYGVNELKTATGSVDPSVLSLSGIYDTGVWSLGYAYERHNDIYGVGAMRATALVPALGDSSKDVGHKLGGSVKFGNTTLTAVWERLEYDSNVATAVAGTTKGYKRDAYALGVMHKMGAGTIRGAYINANNGSCTLVGGAACVTGELGAKLWSLGYSHSMSKRTDLYGIYSVLDNGADARYRFNNAAGVTGVLGGVGAGADSKAISLGIRHTF